MRVLIALALLLLIGCSTTVPVTAKFPEAPQVLLEKCPQLEKLADGSKLSDVARSVTLNYTTYYECAVKHDAFVDWYHKQKNIYESVQ